MQLPTNLVLGSEYEELLSYLCNDETPHRGFTLNIKGLEYRFGGGGVHAAIDNFRITETDKIKIMDIDYSSYYPYIMLLYLPWFWSGMSRDRYKELVKTRITAKQSGDLETAAKLKAVIARSCGLARRENAEMGRRLCVIGQLFLVDLIDKLIRLQDLNIFNVNTDGIIISYPKDDEDRVIEIVECFRQRVRIPIDYRYLHCLAQKNVNCYVAELGGSFIIKNGEVIEQEKDINSLRIKGIERSLPKIVQEALAKSVLYGEDIIAIISSCNELAKFKRQCNDNKELRWLLNGKYYKLPDNTAIYATVRNECGPVGTISDGSFRRLKYTAEHCIADTKSCMKLNMLNRQFYTDIAYSLRSEWIV